MYGNPMQQPGEPSLIFGLIPMLWLSKLRGLRLLSKMILYISLQIIKGLDFFKPLLSAPLQALSELSGSWWTKAELSNSVLVDEA